MPASAETPIPISCYAEEISAWPYGKQLLFLERLIHKMTSCSSSAQRECAKNLFEALCKMPAADKADRWDY